MSGRPVPDLHIALKHRQRPTTKPRETEFETSIMDKIKSVAEQITGGKAPVEPVEGQSAAVSTSRVRVGNDHGPIELSSFGTVPSSAVFLHRMRRAAVPPCRLVTSGRLLTPDSPRSLKAARASSPSPGRSPSSPRWIDPSESRRTWRRSPSPRRCRRARMGLIITSRLARWVKPSCIVKWEERGSCDLRSAGERRDEGRGGTDRVTSRGWCGREERRGTRRDRSCHRSRRGETSQAVFDSAAWETR
jgi:hypothetical protein